MEVAARYTRKAGVAAFAEGQFWSIAVRRRSEIRDRSAGVHRKLCRTVGLIAVIAIAGCSHAPPLPPAPPASALPSSEYIIGPGDNLNIFVWRNPELSSTVPVRPDGRLSIPLVEDVVAIGKTPTQLARTLEQRLSKYIKEPVVTVIATGFVGPFNEQVRVVGEAATPRSIPYRTDMTVLDAMIAVGGLTRYAAGNDAVVVRTSDGKQMTYAVHLDDLIKYGDVSNNVALQPGDILIIPQRLF
jgi:polysaccharide biosynthesis/export protein